MADVHHVSDATFDAEVLQSSLPVLVDFWASWCKPCVLIGPIVEQMSVEFNGRIKVCKMDVEANPETPAKYGIRGIPTLILFHNAQAVDSKVGAASDIQIKAFIENNLPSG